MTKLVFLGLIAIGLAGCTARAEVFPAGYGHRAPAVQVPEGHLPPPGECRIWFPGREPGQQPPPGPCYLLEREVPRGAYLIRG